MRETTVGQVLVNAMLPEDLRDYNRVMDKKNTNKLMNEIVHRYPDQFKQISSQLLKVGYRGAYLTGGQSFSLANMAPLPISRQMQTELNAEVQGILSNAYRRGKKSTDKDVTDQIFEATKRWYPKIEKALDKEDLDTNGLYRQHKGTQASKPGTYRSIRAGDLIYVDQNNKPIPVPVTRSYAQGLTPVQYFAGSFGARKGSVDLQKATQDAGFFCLEENTLVRMGDSSTKCIKDIKVGDTVMGVSDDLHCVPVPVNHVFKNGSRECVKTTFCMGHTHIYLESTKEHKVLRATWEHENYTYTTSVEPIGTPGYFCTLALYDNNKHKYHVTAQDSIGIKNTYDIEVNSDNHLFVLANGLVVSNSKQLVQMAHRLVCIGDDDDDPEHEKDNAQIGYPTTVDDPDNEGSFLAFPVAGYKRNTLLTPKILEDIKRKGFDKIVTRSVIAGGPGNGGIYALDAGIRERGATPVQGDFVGINAVQGISEPLTQAAISSKHSGGVAGASSGDAILEMKNINQMLQVPKHYTGGATHSQCDGRISGITAAPQGGKYIFVGDQRHYVRADNCNDIKVKIGDTVEAGDVMTGGLPNPGEIVKYKGIGEGRRYFVDMFRDALKRAGTGAHRRNIETLSRGVINYVRCNDEVGDYAPDDVVPYCMIASNWKPRSGFTQAPPNQCKGQYLEKPVLHYTIGTRITPSVIKTLNDYKIDNISVHRDPAPFEPEMIRSMGHVSEDPDWCTRLLGAYNKDSILEGARRGAVSNTDGTSYVSALALGDMNFGQHGLTKQLPLDEFAKRDREI